MSSACAAPVRELLAFPAANCPRCSAPATPTPPNEYLAGERRTKVRCVVRSLGTIPPRGVKRLPAREPPSSMGFHPELKVRFGVDATLPRASRCGIGVGSVPDRGWEGGRQAWLLSGLGTFPEGEFACGGLVVVEPDGERTPMGPLCGPVAAPSPDPSEDITRSRRDTRAPDECRSSRRPPRRPPV